jgi:hypothetical protein
VTAPPEPTNAPSADVSRNGYTSSTGGYSLARDEPWLATWEESAAGDDVLVLYSGVSGVRVDAGAGANGDVARSVQEAAAQFCG